MLSMRCQILALMVATAMVAGCSETPQPMGADVDNDQNVLTGGPITGTTIQQLPSAVKETLKERVPHEEIAAIEKTRRDGRVVYDITFIDRRDPELYLRDDGRVMPEPLRAEK
jgi:uncharacterized lipoprotein YajG